MAAMAFVLGQSSAAQTTATSLGAIPIPKASGVSGRQDPAALTELSQHRTAVGSDPWRGMQAQGKIIFGPSDTTGYDATFTTKGFDFFRLDAQTKTGNLSVRLQGHVGKMKDNDGAVSQIPLNTAALGLFPFSLPRLPIAGRPGASLIDHGAVTIAGSTLHRISYEIAGAGHAPTSMARDAVVTDLYFDPASHLLVFSAAAGALEDTRPIPFLFVTNYGDYRKVGTTMVPFHLIATMNGEPYWDLQLSDVHLNPAVDSTYFVF